MDGLGTAIDEMIVSERDSVSVSCEISVLDNPAHSVAVCNQTSDQAGWVLMDPFPLSRLGTD